MKYDATLVGYSHRPIEVRLAYRELYEGQALILEPEPDNKFDANAVKVIEPESEIFLGYLDRNNAASVNFLLEKGKTCSVEISSVLDFRHPVLSITFND